MKYGIIYNPFTRNLGDDFQTFAAARLFENPDFLDRENLHRLDYPVKTIMNGWFMNNPLNWPPSDMLDPLFISFHGRASIINRSLYSYYKQYEPIGCRDYSTLRLFEAINIKTYFSGCLTLTLPKIEVPKTDEIIVVDLLRSNFDDEYREVVKQRIIPKNWRSKVTHISHLLDQPGSSDPHERMQNVESLMKRYAAAKMVVTSLLHCALPCLALGTPVLFIDFGFSDRGTRRSRFEGILDMMNVYSGIKAPFPTHSRRDKMGRLLKLYRIAKHKISSVPESFFENPMENPPVYKAYAEKLNAAVEEFTGRDVI